jgi:hypothetical protein
MPEKFDLQKMLEEIQEENASPSEAPKKKPLTQDEINRLFLEWKKKKAARDSKNEKS